VVAANPERELEFEIERGGGTVVLRGTPSVHMEKDASGATQRIGQLGISGGYDPADTRFIQYGVLGALKSGVSESWFVVDDTIGYLVKIVRGRASADQLGGPIRIAQVAGQVATSGFTPILRFVALISVSIGLLNLFPIPLLDGGHLLFYAIEAVRGRPLSDRAQEYGFRFGLAVVLLLMLFATYNDLLHIRSLFSL